MLETVHFSLMDLVDIAIVTLLVYQIIQLVRGSRALATLIGLGVLALLSKLADELGLYTLNWLLQHVFNNIVVIIVVVFQADIRQALADIGSHRWFLRQSLAKNAVDEIILACTEMAKQRIGALIVIERNIHLDDMIEREGVRIDAKISSRLLMNIFYPKAPLHDGAVIISNGKISAGACILPLAVAKGQNFGTRHRAAIGITKESDAVAVAVSEERGEISVAMRGDIVRSLDVERLRKVLNDIL